MAIKVMVPKEGSMETCLIVKWNYKKGDRVSIGDLLCEVETEKSVFDLESPGTGTILEIFYEEGSEVPVLTTIAFIGELGDEYSPLPQEGNRINNDEKPANEADKPSNPNNESVNKAEKKEESEEKVQSSPRARRLIIEKNVPLSMLKGSGPSGNIVEKDVLKWLSENQPLVPLNMTLSKASGDYTEIPVKGVRKITADRMLSSLLNTAQYTLTTTADAENLIAYRSKFKNSPVVMGIREITINDILLYVVSRALAQFKELNCHFIKGKIFQFNNVNLAFAVDMPKGLMVPVIRKAEKLSLSEISTEARRLSGLCKSGKISPEELTGGTFTLSNLGSLGIDTFTPILNPPQVAILGVGRINLKPVNVNGQVCFKNHIELSLTMNHQIVDGATGARFLKLLSEYIKEIELILMQ